MKPTPSLPVIGVLLAALAAIAVSSWVAWSWITSVDRGTTAGQGGAMRTEANIGGPFQLVDHHGRPVTDKSFQGSFLLIYFGYGFCPDVCPTELANMAAAVDMLGPKADQVVPLFITVDPERDTPGFLADYVANFHPRLTGLTGTKENIAAVAKAYKVYFARSPGSAGDDYLMDHTGFVYLMGPNGKFLTLFRGQTAPEAMAEAIERFMAAASKVGAASPRLQILPPA